jgi:hypothetical protein
MRAAAPGECALADEPALPLVAPAVPLVADEVLL